MSAFDDLLADARALNRMGTTLDLAGQLTGMVGQVQYGIQAARAGEFQAAQLRQNANNAAGSAQRQAADIDRTERVIASNALATAAASGGGASDPGVVSIIANTAAEGAYRKSVALYEGEDRSRSMNLAAETADYNGKLARSNSIVGAGAGGFKAASTLLTGQARDQSLYQRFGMGGPRAPDGGPF